jgi:hypothetical protein
VSCALLNHLDQVVTADEQYRNSEQNRNKHQRWHRSLLGCYAITSALVCAIMVHHWKIGMSMSLNMAASFRCIKNVSAP